MKFEVTVLPVADVERAKASCQGLGWRLDAGVSSGENYRIVPFTPSGSPAAAGRYMAEIKHIVV